MGNEASGVIIPAGTTPKGTKIFYHGAEVVQETELESRYVCPNCGKVSLRWTGAMRQEVQCLDCGLEGEVVSDPDKYGPPMVRFYPPEVTSAPELLARAVQIMADRGKTYDKPGGERSMATAVPAFNIITGQDLTEAEGWLLLQVLKDVRQWQTPGYHPDSAEDCIAYSALKAEALQRAERPANGANREHTGEARS